MLASGSGTNLQALIDSPGLGSDISIVISDRPGAPALERARAAGIRTGVVDFGDFRDRDQFTTRLVDMAEDTGAGALVLAGFMRILAPVAVERYRNRILNIHPSLLPSFPGARAVTRALEYGVKVTGVTVHFVDEEVDHGPIIAQRAVPVIAGDTEESLHARIQAEEHRIYPEVVAAFARGRIEVVGREVSWR